MQRLDSTNNPSRWALAGSCAVFLMGACTATDSIGKPGDGGAGGATLCNLADGRRIPAGAAFTDGCNCCVCTSSGEVACQGAGCNDAGFDPRVCTSDQDCVAQGRFLCVFDPGCESPHGLCMGSGGVCPLYLVSDLAPFEYCGCDGATYAISSSTSQPRQYPTKPYRHYGACTAADPGWDSGAGGAGGAGSGGTPGDVSGTSVAGTGGAGPGDGAPNDAPTEPPSPVFCHLDDGRSIQAGATFANGCNCCACASSGVASCQGAGCPDAGINLGACTSDQDCVARGSVCVFNLGCQSPHGTCMYGGACPLFLVSDLAPFEYCGCDGVTFAISSSTTQPRQFPDKPYQHYGACTAGDPGWDSGAGGAGGAGSGGTPGDVPGTSVTGTGGAGPGDGAPNDAPIVPPSPVFCHLDDGRTIEAGAAYTDGCNCCVCPSWGEGICQAAGCNDAEYDLQTCTSDQDCVAHGKYLCVFDPGCQSPHGLCMGSGGVCPLYLVSDLAPFEYCGCDGATYAISSSTSQPRQYPTKPYQHYGACTPGDPKWDSGVGGARVGDSGSGGS
jgi:hypothetical protein